LIKVKEHILTIKKHLLSYNRILWSELILESTQTISKIEIPVNKIFYSKDSKILSVEILGFTFVGHYKKSTKIGEVLDDIFKSLPDVKITREDICFLDAAHLVIPETTKLKDLKLKLKEIVEEKKGKRKKVSKEKDDTTKDFAEPIIEKKKGKMKKVSKERDGTTKDFAETIEEEAEEEEAMEDYFDDREEKPQGDKQEMLRSLDEDDSMLKSREKEVSKKEKEKADFAPPRPKTPSPPQAGGAAPTTGAPSRFTSAPPPLEELKSEAEEEPQPTRYDINMGFQYYSVMMEQQSYFFYVYFSFKQLIIKDEEGKTVYKTKFTIVTTKEEPPILDLRIEGEGFEVHPLSGKVEVKKDFLNPPVMIFSVLPVKSKMSKKKKKQGEKRFLHVYIDFEGKTVSHSILSITVQPKHFHLDVGPLHFDLTKTQAMLISFISILITAITVAYSLLTLDISGPTTNIITGFVPGIGSLIFLGTFIYTLLKEGIYPIQQQVNSLLNFDKGITTLK